MKSWQHKPISIVRITVYVGGALLILQILQSFNLFPFQNRVFAGRFDGSFEHSSFIPCGYLDTSEMKTTMYWLNLGKAGQSRKEFQPLYEQIRPYFSQEKIYLGEPSIDVFIRFIGYQAEPDFKHLFRAEKGYGHLGNYDNEVTVLRVLKIESFNLQKVKTVQGTINAVTLLVGLIVAVLNYTSTRSEALLRKGFRSFLIGCIVSGEMFWLVSLFNLGCG